MFFGRNIQDISLLM